MKKAIFIILIGLLLSISCCSKPPTGEYSRKVKLKFLTEEFFPIIFIENNKPEGMAVDLLNEAGKILNIKPEIEIQLWNKSYKDALQNPDVFLFPTTMTKEREKEFYWLKPSLKKFNAYFYKRNGSKLSLKSIEDARKYKLATIKGYFSEEVIIEKGFTNIIRYNTPEEAMKALMDKKADLAVFEDFRADIIVTKIGYSISDIIPVYKLLSSELYIAISKKTSSEVINEWQKAFTILSRDKIYYKLYEKWFLRNTLF